jgi:phosphoenolpyruvate-protein kinase (PTS system EI component)
MTHLHGRGVADGIAVGRAVLAVRDARQVRYRLASSGVERERQRLRSARERTRVELEEISSRVSRTVGSAQAAIFAAQLLMLDDPLLTRRADELIRAERINADWALESASCTSCSRARVTSGSGTASATSRTSGPGCGAICGPAAIPWLISSPSSSRRW